MFESFDTKVERTKEMRDTRPIFDNYVSRKVLKWEESGLLPEHICTNKHYLLMLKEKPRIYIPHWKGPLQEIIPTWAQNLGTEYIIIRVFPYEYKREEMFYVNSEGYSYARYCIRLPDAVANFINVAQVLDL